jgi:hypothetical protein
MTLAAVVALPGSSLELQPASPNKIPAAKNIFFIIVDLIAI